MNLTDINVTQEATGQTFTDSWAVIMLDKSPTGGWTMSKKILWKVFALITLLALSTVAYAAGDANAGKEKSNACTSCHGADGQGSEPNTKIAGMSVENFKAAMQAYKSGERNHAMMQMFAKKLSDQDVEDLAAYYSAK